MARKQDSSPSKWQARIAGAKDYRDSIAKRDRWKEIFEEYKGNFRHTLGDSLGHVPIIPANDVFAYVHSLVPSLYYRDPYFTVNPRKQSSILSSRIIEQVINYIWKELEIKDEIEYLLIEAVCVGHSWLKVGYSGVFGEIELSDEERQSQDLSLLQVDEYVRQEEVFVSWESWKNIVFDPASVKPLRDARWLAHRIFRPTESLKRSSQYSNTQDLEPNIFASQLPSEEEVQLSRKPASTKLREHDIPMSTLWEIWDRDSNRIYVIADGHDKFLRNEQWPYPFLDGFPFEMIQFNRIPGEPYPLSDVLPWENQMLEKIKLRSLQLDHIKRFGRQIFSKKGNLGNVEKEKFQQGITGSIIEYKSEMPQILQYPTIQTDMYAVEDRIRLDEDNISGQSNVVRGAPQKVQSRTLGELDRLIEFSQSRSSKKQDVLRNFLEKIARKIVQFKQEYGDMASFSKISGDNPREILMAFAQTLGPEKVTPTGFFYTKDDIKGEHDISVKVGPEIPLDRRNRMELLAQILKVLPSLGMAPGSKTAKVLGKMIMRDFDLKEVETEFEREINEQNSLEAMQKIITQAQVARSQGGLGGIGNLPIQQGIQPG